MKVFLLWTLVCSTLTVMAFQRNNGNTRNEEKKMDAKAQKSYYLVPDFYDVVGRDSGDSLLVFECYDSAGKDIWQTDTSAFSKVSYIAYKRYYYDTARMIEDSLYGEIPTREDRLIAEYFKWGKTAWIKKVACSHATDTLWEYRNEIVKRDTFRAYPGILPGSRYNLYYVAYFKTGKK